MIPDEELRQILASLPPKPTTTAERREYVYYVVEELAREVLDWRALHSESITQAEESRRA